MTSGPQPICLQQGLLGQEAVLARLSAARTGGRLAHSFLLLGPRGCGKTRLALAFAQELFCAERDAPCGLCPACRKVAHLTHPDLHLLFPLVRDDAQNPDAIGRILESYARDPYALVGTGASASIGIDRVRALKEEVAKASVEGGRRVVILSAADRMTEQAAQATLKLVEEPPADTLLILEAEETTGLLPTLVSRCQRVRVNPLGRSRLAELLESALEVPAAESLLLAALSGGSLGRALELRGSGVVELRDRMVETFDLPLGGAVDGAEIERRVRRCERSWSADLALRGVELLVHWWRDLMSVQCGLEAEELWNADRVADLEARRALLPVAELSRRMRVVEEMATAVQQNVNPTLALHAAVTRIAGGPQEEDRFVRS